MAHTTQAHDVRGFATPEQVSARKAQAGKLEDLSYKLHSLAEIIKLAAFADGNGNASDVLFYVSEEIEGTRPVLEEARAVLVEAAQEGGAA